MFLGRRALLSSMLATPSHDDTLAALRPEDSVVQNWSGMLSNPLPSTWRFQQAPVFRTSGCCIGKGGPWGNGDPIQ